MSKGRMPLLRPHAALKDFRELHKPEGQTSFILAGHGIHTNQWHSYMEIVSISEYNMFYSYIIILSSFLVVHGKNFSSDDNKIFRRKKWILRSRAACRHFFLSMRESKLKQWPELYSRIHPVSLRRKAVCIFGEGRHDEGTSTHRKARSSTGGSTLKENDCHYTRCYMASGHRLYKVTSPEVLVLLMLPVLWISILKPSPYKEKEVNCSPPC